MPDFKTDVIVVGAGASGIAAASTLIGKRMSVRILEARERVGGRVYTLRPAGLQFPVELGAEFIHGKPAQIIQLLAESGMRTCPMAGDHWDVNKGKFREQSKFNAKVEAVYKLLSKQLHRPKDESYVDFAKRIEKKDPSLRSALNETKLFVQSYHLADPKDVSIKWLARGELVAQEIGTEAERVVDGYDKLLHHLLDADNSSKGALELNTVVESIDWRQGEVLVTAKKDGEQVIFSSTSAIITVPVTVLRAPAGTRGAIVFSPPLQEKLRAAAKLPTGNVTRVVLQFAECFWDRSKINGESDAQLGFIHCSEAPIPVWWSHSPIWSTVLTGWAGLEATRKLSNETKSLLDAAIDSLSIIFKMKKRHLRDLVVNFYTHDWNSDPFALGGYTYHAVNGLKAACALAEPVENTLYFAGEATEITGLSATVYGAMLSGFRAAAEVLATHGLTSS